jgi:hypothetical protein
MGRKDGEAPRQDSEQFKANDAIAKIEGGQTAVTSVAPCSFWKLDVHVTVRPNARRQKLPQPTIDIAWSNLSRDSVRCTTSMDDKASMGEMVGHGSLDGKCRARATGWYLESEKEVSLADGDDKQVDLVMLPHVWVAFEVRDHRSNDLVESVKIKARHASIGTLSGPTPADAALDIEHVEFRPGHTLELTELEHDEFCFEVVGSVTSV